MSTATHETPTADAQDAAAALALTAPDPLSSDGVAETRTYRGRTVDELIPKIQDELGRDAIVIRRQSGLTGGFAGFFQRPYVEIEARRGSPGIDRYDEDDAAPALPGDLEAELQNALDAHAAPTLDAHAAPIPAFDAHAAPTPDFDAELDAAPSRPSALDEEFRELTAASLGSEPAAAQPLTPQPAREALPAPFAAALAAAEAAAATSTPSNLQPPNPQPPAPQQSAPHSPPPPPPGPQPATAAAAATTSAPQPSLSRSRARDAIERRLLSVGVGEELMRELLEAATGHVMPFMPARTSLARATQEALRQRIPTPRALPAGNATIAVVGPGGSGKTSLCGALLSAYSKRSALSAACATVVEGDQRGTLELLLDPDILQPAPLGDPQTQNALRAAREQGLVLLDTPAVSPADTAGVRALAALLAELRADRVVLALPATLGRQAAAQLLDALQPLNADAIAITHADETDQLGVALDAACTCGLAPVYTLQSGRGAGLVQVQPDELAERLLAE